MKRKIQVNESVPHIEEFKILHSHHMRPFCQRRANMLSVSDKIPSGDSILETFHPRNANLKQHPFTKG